MTATVIPITDSVVPFLKSAGLQLPDSIERAEWEAIGKKLGAVLNERLWYIGDWLCFGERKWGSMYEDAERITGLAYQTLAIAKAVADRFEITRRRVNLSWSHHREVYALEPVGQERLLDVAIAEKLSQKALREKVRVERGETDPTCAGILPSIAFASGDFEWYTPAEYIEAARDVLGWFDLDPASSEKANRTVRASLYFDAQMDGLAHHWKGRIWLNPPYATGLVDRFIDKLVFHAKEGDIHAAIVLVNNATETGWFRRLTAIASDVCFPSGRLHFLRPDGTPGNPLQGQAVLYLGPEPDAFRARFAMFGPVATWWRA